MKKLILCLAAAVCAACLSACAASSGQAQKLLMGLEWYADYDDVKTELQSYTLLNEREIDDTVQQRMLDYEDAALYDGVCDVTLCFTDAGLIGLNYHDIHRNRNYREWHSIMESYYGLPTEEGSGMASWYDDPAGKNTAIYLFNLEEGVQVSVYATADSPDHSYERKIEVPAPEIRTPIVPVSAAVTERTAAESTAAAPQSDTETEIGTQNSAARTTAVRRTETRTEPSAGSSTETSHETESAGTGSTMETTAETTTEPAADLTGLFLLNGLRFYGSPENERVKMNGYTQRYEYRTEEAGQPWELILEYQNVPYAGKNCDAVLCFTSLGLVGISFCDTGTAGYHAWVNKITTIYGTPDMTEADHVRWQFSLDGTETTVHVFALEDGVQISFFADDSGSERSVKS